ncbi:hypothetical protein NL108_013802 [Boleophthalmus pectinirostris]|nr:hypothetical protein NL108_013802 [Boleophthalmus pectinirostris]
MEIETCNALLWNIPGKAIAFPCRQAGSVPSPRKVPQCTLNSCRCWFLQWNQSDRKCRIVFANKRKGTNISANVSVRKVTFMGVCFFFCCWIQNDTDTRHNIYNNIHTYQKGEVSFTKENL